ncbi:phosphate acyltransferase PlsX [Pseudaeromonas sharmana]|uniref:Phosphate acyltransferase n=1 Tax=Pseudaeromonas sharmana TaxID=328412 RepID=A0ABV8CPN8_9GAMM
MSTLTLALDLMGGDYGPSETVPAAAQALSLLPHLNLLLVGDIEQCRDLLDAFSLSKHPNVSFLHATQSVSMAESPAFALRRLSDSSMRKAIEAVAAGQANACVSAGNTGALMAIAKHVLKVIPGIERPALMSCVPTISGGRSVLLDLGANVNCEAENLRQFAVLGSVVAEAVLGMSRPRIALLNVGAEANKGNIPVRTAAELLATTPGLNYCGYIEGDALFQGAADVIVCDGFVGNIALKTAEGMVRLLSSASHQQMKGWAGWLQSWLTRFFKRRLSHLNPDQYNGASLLGLRGIVIKSHGRAERSAFTNAILQAVVEVERQLPARIAERIDALPLNRR